MGFLVFSIGLLTFSLILLIFGSAGLKKDRLNERLDNIRDIGHSRSGRIGAVNEELRKPLLERVVPFFQSIVKKIAVRLPQRKSPKLTEDLRRAGIRMRTEEYNTLRLIIFIAFAAFTYLICAAMKLQMAFLIAIPLYTIVIVYIIMRFLLKSAIKSRREKMLRQMPEVLDLLSVSVDAGLSFDASLLHVSNRMNGPLVTEFRVMQREITLGRTKREALTNLALRCMIDEIQSFSNAIIQSEQLGISLRNVLKAQSKLMRQQHRQRIEEKAMKAPIKIIFPLVLFVLPVLFIVLLGPSVLNMIKTLGK